MKRIIFALFVCLLLGCSGGKEEKNVKFSKMQTKQLELSETKALEVLEQNPLIIDFNDFLTKKEVKSSEFIDTVEFVTLETTEESLIAEINKLVCTEKRFFIFDSDIGKNVFIFSETGHFIRKIPTGEGPEEIYNPADIAVDDKKLNLIVYNRKGLSFFDFDGNFIKREHMPFNFKNFRLIPGGYLFITIPNQNDHLGELSNMQVLITDTNFRIISAGLPYHYSNDNSYGITDYLSSLGKNVSFSFKFSDKVYEFQDTLSVKEKYQLNFKKNALPVEYVKLSTEKILKILKQNNYFYYMGDYIECENHEYFALYNNFNKNMHQTIIFRDKLTGNCIGGNRVLINTGKLPIFSFPLTSYKDKFVASVSSSSINKYLSEKKRSTDINVLLKNIDDDSNPILIKYKLKKF